MGLTTRRRTEPAMQPDDLPPPDFVVLSHHHGDHFDRVAARGLDKDLPIITNAHAAKKLRRQGFRRPVELDTWQTQRVERGATFVRITSMPGKHAPQPLGLAIPSVMGSMLEFGRDDDVALRLYITGDTLLHDRLAEIPRRYPDIDLCLIHLGGTRVAGILLTMNADQGVRALQLIAPKVAVPIHYDDYRSSANRWRRSSAPPPKRRSGRRSTTCNAVTPTGSRVKSCAPADPGSTRSTRSSHGRKQR